MGAGVWLAAALIAVLAIAVVVLLISDKQKKKAEGFTAAARAQAAASGVEAQLDTGKHPKLILRIGAPPRGQFEVRREGEADRLVESLSLARTIRTSEPSFAERFHVDSDDEAFASAYFADPAKRAAVETLFAAGCTRLSWYDGRATAVWEGYQPKDEDAGFVGGAAAALKALTVNVAAAAPGPAPLAEGGWTEKKFKSYVGPAMIVGFVAIYAMLMFGTSLYGRPVEGFEMFAASLRFSIPAAVIAFAIGASRIAGKSWFLKGAGRLALAAALIFPSLGYVGFQLANSCLDTAPAASFVVPVTGKHYNSGKHRSYYVHVQAWRPGLYDPRFEVSWSTYNRVVQGRTRAHLATRPGRLGHEWLVSLEFTDS